MAKRSRSTTPVEVTAAAVEEVVAVDSVVDEEVEAVDTVVAHSAVEVAAVDTMAASEAAVVEVAVSADVVDAAAAVADVAAATTVTKMATLLANALRDAAMEVTTTAIRQDNKSTRDSNDQKMKEKKTKHESPRSFPVKPTFILVCLMQYLYNYH